MSSNFEELQRKWKEDKKDIENQPNTMSDILLSIEKKKKWSHQFHYGNSVILFIVLIVITAFFYFVAPVQEVLSRVGAGLMIGGLIVRIVVELISVTKSKKIDIEDNVLKNTQSTITFYKFRKKIHGPLTISIIALYTIGFYMINPEFNIYFELWQMVLMDVSYVVGAVILIKVIRKNVKKEIRELEEIIELKNRIIEETGEDNEK
ncbi:hypothetical protein [Aquimarina sp. 2201CG5-10]|uniref:hypothetical protein n=1 Tax=Aquimarina callyspongiae TaxID=3098150 RepID=UPI002AB5B8CC|nr:hypothetical protein [Aquimarina sp. 2201CG5-10]MDY8137784.1 hypothetical protein [Aquimarina sp. 2201CG5-10]